MSTNLSPDSGNASNPNPAASTSTDTPQTSAADAAQVSAGQEHDDAASGTKDASIDDLDRQYKENLLSTDKPEVDAAKPVEPKPEETVEAEPVEEPVEVTEPEQDDLDEQTGPRTFEQLKKQFPRVSDAPLKEIARVEAERHALQTEIDSVGGTVGLELAKAMLPAILSASPTDEEVDGVFQSVTETNPALMQRMSWNILTHSLNEQAKDPATGLPISVVTGNAIIKQFLNENYDVEKLSKLIAYDEAGLLDQEELDKELETFSGKSDRERQLEERVKSLEAGKQQETVDLESKRQTRVTEHVAKTEKYILDNAMQRVVAIAEEYGWTASKEELASSDPVVKQTAEFKVALGELLTPWLNDFLRSHNKWGGIESLGKQEQAFNLDGNPTRLLKSNGDDVINAAAAAFKSKVRTMNPLFAKIAGLSRKVQLKEKTTRSGAVDSSEIPPVKKPESNGNRPPDEISRLDEQYRQATRG